MDFDNIPPEWYPFFEPVKKIPTWVRKFADWLPSCCSQEEFTVDRQFDRLTKLYNLCPMQMADDDAGAGIIEFASRVHGIIDTILRMNRLGLLKETHEDED